MAAGALSYLIKSVSAEDLAEAIRSASSGRSTLRPKLCRPSFSRSWPRSPARSTSPRVKREVLALMVKGVTNPEIAERLVVSRSTAKAHVSNVLSKLGVSNRAEAVAMAVQNKLV